MNCVVSLVFFGSQLPRSTCASFCVFSFLHWDSMYGTVARAFWASINELHCVHAFWQLILWRPCLENSFLQVFLGELGFLMKKPTYTLKIFTSIFWFSLSLFSFLQLFCQQILRNMLNYFRKIHKIPCKVYKKISASTWFIYPDGNNNICLYYFWSLSWFSALHDVFYILFEKSHVVFNFVLCLPYTEIWSTWEVSILRCRDIGFWFRAVSTL